MMKVMNSLSPTELEEGEVVYVVDKDEIYININNKLIRMSNTESSNLGDSTLEREKIKELIKEVLYNEDDEISEIKQLFVNCLAQHFEKYLDEPVKSMSSISEIVFGMSKSELHLIKNQVYQYSQRLGMSSVPSYYTFDIIYNENRELKREMQELKSEIMALKEKTGVLENELHKN